MARRKKKAAKGRCLKWSKKKGPGGKRRCRKRAKSRKRKRRKR